MKDIPYSVVDINNYVMNQSASEERAKDRKWEIENEGWPWKYQSPLTIRHDIPWDSVLEAIEHGKHTT